MCDRKSSVHIKQKPDRRSDAWLNIGGLIKRNLITHQMLDRKSVIHIKQKPGWGPDAWLKIGCFAKQNPNPKSDAKLEYNI